AVRRTLKELCSYHTDWLCAKNGFLAICASSETTTEKQSRRRPLHSVGHATGTVCTFLPRVALCKLEYPCVPCRLLNVSYEVIMTIRARTLSIVSFWGRSALSGIVDLSLESP